jgi:hypothetical protein
MSDVLEATIATVRAYAAAVRPARVVLLHDRGDGSSAAMVEWTADGLHLLDGDRQEEVGPVIAVPHELPELREIPASAIHVDPAQGQISAPVGAVAHLVEGVRALAAAAGGRSVAAVDFATADADVTLSLAAREGEPVIAAVGDDQFELPDV